LRRRAPTPTLRHPPRRRRRERARAPGFGRCPRRPRSFRKLTSTRRQPRKLLRSRARHFLSAGAASASSSRLRALNRPRRRWRARASSTRSRSLARSWPQNKRRGHLVLAGSSSPTMECGLGRLEGRTWCRRARRHHRRAPHAARPPSSTARQSSASPAGPLRRAQQAPRRDASASSPAHAPSLRCHAPNCIEPDASVPAGLESRPVWSRRREWRMPRVFQKARDKANPWTCANRGARLGSASIALLAKSRQSRHRAQQRLPSACGVSSSATLLPHETCALI